MKKWIGVFSLFILFAFFLFPSPLLPSVYSLEKSLYFWKTQTPHSTVYLLGSIHLLKKDMKLIDPLIEEAFDRSTHLVVEVDTTKLNPLDVVRLTTEKGMYKGEENLKSNLSPETLKKLLDHIEPMGMNLQQVNRMRPWFLAMNLTLLETSKLGFDSENGIDLYFLNKAKGKKEILQLESFEEQLDFLSATPQSLEDLSLSTAIDEMPKTERMINLLLKSWNAGDPDSLLAITEEPSKMEPKLKPELERLLSKRNISMVNILDEYIKSGGSYFVIIGAAHFGGEDGVLSLLKKRGYVVKQVKK